MTEIQSSLEPEKRKKIQNKNYRKFLDTGEIVLLTYSDLEIMRQAITRRHEESKALLTLLHLTGARPAELLEIKACDIIKSGNYIIVKVIGKKRGLTRQLHLPIQLPYVMELYQFAQRVYPQRYLLYHFKGHRVRMLKTRRGEREYIDTTYKVYYAIKKWSRDINIGQITPYYLRHNRISELAMDDASPEEMRQWKGAKDLKSIFPYMHQSSESSKKTGRRLMLHAPIMQPENNNQS